MAQTQLISNVQFLPRVVGMAYMSLQLVPFRLVLPSPQLIEEYQLANLVQATALYFSTAKLSVAEIWKRIDRIYEKFGAHDEWQLCDQGEIIGYRATERMLLPNSEITFNHNQAVHWHPSVGSVRVGDTVLIKDTGYETLTPTQNWPSLIVQVKGQSMERPDILIREVTRSVNRPST